MDDKPRRAAQCLRAAAASDPYSTVAKISPAPNRCSNGRSGSILAAVYHAHSPGKASSAPDAAKDRPRRAARPFRRAASRPRRSPHFVKRVDARERIRLRRPALSGPFFDALCSAYHARVRPTERRVIDARQMLYAVFGTHGIKHYAPGVAAIKRTSPSAGAPSRSVRAGHSHRTRARRAYHCETASRSLSWNAWMPRVRVTWPARSPRADVFRRRACPCGASRASITASGSTDVTAKLTNRCSWIPGAGRAFYLTATHLGLRVHTAAINVLPISRVSLA